MQSKLLKHLTGFRKNHKTHVALLVMIEKEKAVLNRKLKGDPLFMHFSKVFDSLDHSILLT